MLWKGVETPFEFCEGTCQNYLADFSVKGVNPSMPTLYGKLLTIVPKNGSKRAKIGIFDQKQPRLSDFFLVELGSTCPRPHPLSGKSLYQKKLADVGVLPPPPPLAEKSSF